jgi:hypothetical protein
MANMIKELDFCNINKEKQRCFGGAWYHKVMSVPHDFLGITGVVTLPLPFIKRFDDGFNNNKMVDFNHKNLDVSSIYMGGHATDESDVGLAFSRAILNNQITEGACVYRPFWRYITDQFSDEGGYDLANKRYYAASVLSNHNGMKNVYAQYHPSFSEHYYLPGDTLRMTLISPKPDFLQLTIEVIEVSTLPYSVNLRKKYLLKTPADFVSPLFQSMGHGTKMPKTYKRVNAIDQARNEGKTAIPTKTSVYNALWHECHLVYSEDGKQYLTPLNEASSVSMSCPNEQGFITTAIDSKTGRQNITIEPKRI